MVPEEIRELASLAAQCRDPAWRNFLRKKAQKARRELDARVGALPWGKVVKKPVLSKLRVNGRATEDREEWCEEVRLHCEKCYDDKSETPVRRAGRIRAQKPDARLEKGLRRFRAIALLSVFSKWCTTVLVDLLHEEKEPIEWMRLHVGAGCEL